VSAVVGQVSMRSVYREEHLDIIRTGYSAFVWGLVVGALGGIGQWPGDSVAVWAGRM
jgi:hypothetical protein